MSASEPVLGDRARWGRDATVSGVGRLLAALMTLAAVLIATNILDPADYGRLALVLTASSVAYALTASWTTQQMYVLGAEELSSRGVLAQTSTARMVVVASATAVLLPVVGLSWWLFGPTFSVPVLLAFVVATAGYLGCEHVITMLETSGRYPAAAVLQVARPTAYAAALGAVLAVGSTRLDAVLWCVVASWVVGGTAAGFAAASLPIRPLELSRDQVRRLWHRGSRFIVFSISALVIGALDLYMIRAFVDDVSVGHYAIAYQCFAIGTVLTSALLPVVTPRLSRREAEEGGAVAEYLFAVRAAWLPGTAAVACLAIAVVGPVLDLAFGPDYRAATQPAIVLVLAWVFHADLTALTPVLINRRRERLMSAAIGCALVVNATLDVLLLGVLHTGIWAAALATTGAYALVWAVYARNVEVARGLLSSAWWMVPGLLVMASPLVSSIELAVLAVVAAVPVAVVVTRRIR